MMTPNERLLLLADKLEQNAADPTGMKFDLHEWLRPDEKRKAARDCGTVGCAVGLAMITPEFNEEGFGGRMIPELDYKKWRGIGMGDCHDWPAVRTYFGLEQPEASHLFTASAYGAGPTRGAEAELAVAKRIREFVTART